MLTREQIDHAWEILNELFKQILYAVNIAPYKNIHDQAKQAINLATENAEMIEHIGDIEFERATLIGKNEELEEDQRRGNQKIKEVSIAYGKLQAENELLKAKLDTVRKAATEETYGTANMSWSKAMQKILEIIDKESDNDA